MGWSAHKHPCRSPHERVDDSDIHTSCRQTHTALGFTQQQTLHALRATANPNSYFGKGCRRRKLAVPIERVRLRRPRASELKKDPTRLLRRPRAVVGHTSLFWLTLTAAAGSCFMCSLPPPPHATQLLASHRVLPAQAVSSRHGNRSW